MAEPSVPAERSPSSEFWRDRRVVVTGGAGFLGGHIVRRLVDLGCRHVFVPRRIEFDLTEHEAVRRMYAKYDPEIVLHLAAEVGGIGANRDHPGRFFYANMAMGLFLIEEARRTGIERFVQLGTICAYPKITPVPFLEQNLWDGYPEETNAPYGVAKKALLVQLQAYRDEYGMNGVYLLPVNLYGPGDNFDPATSHVIPALIRKRLEARDRGEKQVVLWGTGKATREFLHADDCARGVLLAAEHTTDPEPVNLGTGEEITILDLAHLIADTVGLEAQLVFDKGRPDGQPRRCLDTRRALDRFGFRAHIPFREGLAETVEWYERTRNAAPAESNR